MTGHPIAGQTFMWRGQHWEVMSVEWIDRYGDGHEWIITARRWIKSKNRWSANAGTYRWRGIEGKPDGAQT